MKSNEENRKEQKYAYTKDPRKLARFLITMLWISLGFSVLGFLSELMQMNFLGSGRFSTDMGEANDFRQQVAGLLYATVFIVTGVAFLKWTHRANLNCHGFGAPGMKFTPGWSIAYYFVPFLNLYRPYFAMHEIWKVSANPADWEDESGEPLLCCWWALWLLSNVVSQASLRMSMRAETIEELQFSTGVSMISYVLDIPLDIVAISVVTKIAGMQERLVKNRSRSERGVS